MDGESQSIRMAVESLWIEYAKQVRDSDVVFQHMYNHKIALANPKLYVYWAFYFEKYKREFEATAIVLTEGLKQVDDREGEQILEQFKSFGDRMNVRHTRDVRDELGPLGPAFIIQENEIVEPTAK